MPAIDAYRAPLPVQCRLSYCTMRNMQFQSTDKPLADIQSPCVALPLETARALDDQVAPRGYLLSALRHAKD